MTLRGGKCFLGFRCQLHRWQDRSERKRAQSDNDDCCLHGRTKAWEIKFSQAFFYYYSAHF